MFEYRPCLVGKGKIVHANPRFKASSLWASVTACKIGPVPSTPQMVFASITCKSCLRAIELYRGKLTKQG